MESLSSSEFAAVEPVTQGLVRCMFSFISTKVVEDAFQRLRFLESRGQANRQVSSERLWYQLINRGILNRIHGFDEGPDLDVGGCRLYEGLPRRPLPPATAPPRGRRSCG